MTVELTKPFPFEALPRIWGWIEPYRHKVLDDFGPQNLGEFVSTMAEKWKRQTTWAVYAAGELGGMITFEQLTPPPAARSSSKPWLGTAHFLFKPEFQGKGLALNACRDAVSEMFELHGIQKLEFYAHQRNIGLFALLNTLGARREGKLKKHTRCGGKPTDVWIYGLTRKEEAPHGTERQPGFQLTSVGVQPGQCGL